MTDKTVFKAHIRDSLLKMGLLVEHFVKHELDIEEFVKEYGNYFYYEALDGHEADEEQSVIFNEFSEAITFDQLVQQEIVDKVFIGPPELEDEYLKSGRISKSEAIEKLRTYLNEYQSFIHALNVT